MSDGIEILSPCCNYHYAKQKEGDHLKIKLTHNDFEIYDSRIPVYTCGKCGKTWAVERVVKANVDFKDFKTITKQGDK